jgi:signal transduction histidine kinase
MRFGLTGRLLAATLVLALVVSLAFAFLLRDMAAVTAARGVSQHSLEEVSTVRQVRNLLIDLESGQRGFIITGDPNFLAPWEAGRRALPERTTALADMADDPGQAARARQLKTDVLAYITDYSLPLVEAARRGDGTVRSGAVSADGERRMEALRRSLDNYNATESELSAGQEANADGAYRRSILLTGGGLVVCVLAIGILTGYLARGVVAPVRRIAKMAQRLADGDLGARVAETGQAEIGVLERSFNLMAQSLERGHDELARVYAEQAALRRVATLVANGSPASDVFSAVSRESGLIIGAEITRLSRFEADGRATVVGTWRRAAGNPVAVGTCIPIDGIVAGPVRQTGNPARMIEESPPELQGGSYSAVGAPIRVGGGLWGVITALSPQMRPLPNETETRMAQFTDLVGTAVANAQARADLLASRARIVAAADDSRRRIERNLHDGVQQQLVSLQLRLRGVEQMLPPAEEEARQELAAASAMVAEATEDVRAVSRGIHPAILSEGGLVPALKALSRASTQPMELDLHVAHRLPPSVEVAAYYVVAEALSNAAKHAHASVVRLRAEVEDGRLCLTVGDDGVGGANPAHGSGLIGLTDRVEALGGAMTVTSHPGAGTTIHAELPLSGPGLG